MGYANGVILVLVAKPLEDAELYLAEPGGKPLDFEFFSRSVYDDYCIADFKYFQMLYNSLQITFLLTLQYHESLRLSDFELVVKRVEGASETPQLTQFPA